MRQRPPLSLVHCMGPSLHGCLVSLIIMVQISTVQSLGLRSSFIPKPISSTRLKLKAPHTGIVAPFDPRSDIPTGGTPNAGYSSTKAALPLVGSSDPAAKGISAGAKSPIGIRYKRGAVLTDPIDVYVLWVGKFTATQKELVRVFINSLNPTADPRNTVALWWNITTLYYNRDGKRASSRVRVAGERTLRRPRRVQRNAATKRLEINSANGIVQMVKEAVDKDKGGTWPANPSAVYAVFTSSDIFQRGMPTAHKSSFCSSYCGWHSSLKRKGTSLKYFWVGLADKLCPSRCIPLQLRQANVSAPEGGVGIHSAISMFAHELSEVVTNPGGNSWVRNNGLEDADICAWKFGAVTYVNKPGGNRIAYNLVGQRRRRFFVQANWDFIEGRCKLGR